ncbi:putative homeodomain-like HTH_23 containing protein 6 [Homarus americanus]|uniref:Putative homeodomain-like HTH_23 containing protein 4 n=1 Tax=Homarus americanus TaxID=6706 RepID=A0A8J5JWE4_HOMAM|nr:putative homeodomain-like HTH_23 containing protein 4 [Homarus americanus]KAG7162433.1 putative homeodomain-like HTH_23 containing protein 5 [Homarus americanus]KAG7162602.1 putative homeodomain-like HTH_23 containing protein 6 [Homarus americanus]
MEKRPTCSPFVTAYRGKIVCLWISGMSARKISQEIGISITTVYRWIRRWQREGTIQARPYHGEPLPTSWGHNTTISSSTPTQPLTLSACVFDSHHPYCNGSVEDPYFWGSEQH